MTKIELDGVVFTPIEDITDLGIVQIPIPLPQDENQAAGMALVAMSWLQANAPHRIRQTVVEFTDQWECKHTLTLDQAAKELKEYYDAWPCGLEEIESALRTARNMPPSSLCQHEYHWFGDKATGMSRCVKCNKLEPD